MSEKFRRHFLKDKDARALSDKASEKLKIDLERIFKAEVNIELIQTEFAEIYLINGRPLLVKTAEDFFPTLIFNEFFAFSPKVIVNMGAVPYVCNGANIMAPGIVRFEGEFRKGDFVLVVDEKHGKPIALGEVVYDSENVEQISHGVVVRSIHFVGDRIWNFIKRLGFKS